MRETAARGGVGRARGSILLGLVAFAAAVLAQPAGAQVLIPGVDSPPIPQGPGAGDLEAFEGARAPADRFASPAVPRHPFMAPNGLSNIHVDAFQTDVN